MSVSLFRAGRFLVLALPLIATAVPRTGHGAAGFARLGRPVSLQLAGRPQVRCSAATLEQCRDPNWRKTQCGKLAMAAARTDPNARCNELLGRDAQSVADRLPTREVMTPQVSGSNGSSAPATGIEFDDCHVNAPGRTCAHVSTYNHLGQTFAGRSQSPMGDVLSRMAYFPASNTSQEALAFRFADQFRRSSWDANGVPVNSCREYIWEKYYDYSRFELAAAPTQNDPRELYNIAFGPPDGPQSIGSRAMAGIPLSQKNGLPTGVTIEFPQDQVKNTFFTLPYPEDWEQTLAVRLDCIEREVIYPHAVHLNDQALAEKLAGTAHHNESFAWHKAASEGLALAGYLDEELYYYEGLRENFAALLERRAVVAAQCDAYKIDVFARVGDQQNTNPNPFDTVGNPGDVMGAALAAALAGVNLPSAQGLGAAPGLAFIPAVDFSAIDPVSMADWEAAANTFADQTCTWFFDVPEGLHQYYLALGSLDAQIEAALHAADALGCLDDTPNNPCDWSPRLFAKQVSKQFGDEREHDYKKCLTYTKNDFQKLKTKSFHVSTAEIVPGCDTQDFRASPGQVEHYEACVDEWIRRVFATIVAATGESPVDPGTGKLRVGKRLADSEKVGGAIASATLDYTNAFAVTGFEPPAQNAADLALSTEGSVNASASLFGIGATLASGKFKMTNQQVDVDLVVFNQVVYADSIEGQFNGAELTPFSDSQAYNPVFVESQTIVPVLGIPLTLRGSITGQVGMEYVASAVRQPNPANTQLVAVVSPFMGVDANASVSVDLAIIEAGVKGSIAIVHLQNPITTGLTVAATVPGNEDIFLTVKSGAELQLSSLSGYMAAFGEIDFGFWSESTEVPIFSWNGLSTRAPLYKVDFDVNADALFMAATLANAGY